MGKLVHDKKPRYNSYVYSFGLDVMRLIGYLETEIKELKIKQETVVGDSIDDS